jgi:hypothetical protein
MSAQAGLKRPSPSSPGTSTPSCPAPSRAWDEAVEKRDPTIPPRRFKQVTSAQRAVEDLRAGRDPGATDASAQAEPGAVFAGRLLEAWMAARAAERIGDPELVAEWRRREAEAARALARVANEDEAAFLQTRVAALTGGIAERIRAVACCAP